MAGERNGATAPARINAAAPPVDSSISPLTRPARRSVSDFCTSARLSPRQYSTVDERIFLLERIGDRAQRLVFDHAGIEHDLAFAPGGGFKALRPVGAAIKGHVRRGSGFRGTRGARGEAPE